MSTYNVVFHEKVAPDFYEAFYWYESQQLGLGELFLKAICEKIEQISLDPNLYGEKFRKDIKK